MSRNKMFDRDDSSSGSSSMPSWLEEFAIAYEKKAEETAVDHARKRQADSDYYSQISAIIGGKKKHATVDSIVKEYQELTGLKQYLQTLAERESKDDGAVKTAQLAPNSTTSINNSVVMINVDEDSLPESLPSDLKDKIKQFVNNKVNSYRGYVSVPAVQHDLLHSLSKDGLEPFHVYDAHMTKFIGNILSDYLHQHPKQKQHDGNLGMAVIEIEDDGSNKDFLHSLHKKQ